MAEEKRLQYKRATKARWLELGNDKSGPGFLSNGEPGYEYDTGRMKIGDGIHTWNELIYEDEKAGDRSIPVVKTKKELPTTGNVNRVYRVSDEKALYQWNSETKQYESLNQANASISNIQIISGGKANG